LIQLKDVDVVQALVDDDVAAQPREIELVVHLELELVPLRLLRHERARGAHVPERAAIHDVADRAILHALDRFEIAGLVPALETHADLEVLLLRFLGRREHAANAVRVHRHRLSRKACLPCRTASSNIIGRYVGGVAQTTTSHAAMTFL